MYSNLARSKNRNEGGENILLETQGYEQKREYFHIYVHGAVESMVVFFLSYKWWEEELRQSSVYLPFCLLLAFWKVFPLYVSFAQVQNCVKALIDNCADTEM